MDVENVEVDKRLDLIRAAAGKLTEKISPYDQEKIASYIEALCRHRDLPVSAVGLPAVLKPAANEP